MEESQVVEEIVEETVPSFEEPGKFVWVLVGIAALAAAETAYFKVIKPVAKKIRSKFNKNDDVVVTISE